MDSSSLTPAQIAALQAAVGRQLRYLGKLRDRMDRTGFTPKDELWRAVDAAYNGVHGLNVTLHYLAHPNGTGRPRRD